MRIIKYKLTSQNSEEYEFEVTDIIKTETTVTSIRKVDENGTIISAREVTRTEVKSEVNEGILAVSLPSKTPAIVEIMETDVSGPKISELELEKRKPFKWQPNPGERVSPIDLNKALYPEEGRAKPQALPKAGEITWAQ